MGGTPSTDIGPGLGAFIAFFALAIILWLLMRNMNGRMRRMAYRERERIEALETQERTASGATGAPDDAPQDPDGSGPPGRSGPGA